MSLDSIKISQTKNDGSQVQIHASGNIARLLQSKLQSGKLQPSALIKPVTGHESPIIHNDEDLLVLDMGTNNLIAITKDALRNVLKDFALSSHDFVVRPIELIRTKNMRIMSVLGIDVLVSPMSLLSLSAQPVIGKSSLTPAVYPFDQNGNITFNGTTSNYVIFRTPTAPDVRGGRFFAIAGKVTPYTTLSGLTTVTFETGNFKFDLKLEGSAGAFVFGIPKPILNYERRCVTDTNGPEITTEVLGFPSVFDRVYEFAPHDLLLDKPGNDVIIRITAVNANIQIYPITIDETIKTAALTAFASGRPEALLESALNDI